MAPPLSQDRLVRKEVALGVVREYEPPQEHIGLRMVAPWKEVQSDDVIFSYNRGISAGLAPSRAEDAESELAGKDDSIGSGRASLVDWALKDHYDPSDVSRYREGLILAAGAQSVPLTVASMTEDWASKVARDQMLRRRKLDNRIEWMIMGALDNGSIAYNDGKTQWSVDFGRPVGQQDMATPSGELWSSVDADPIEDIESLKESAFDTHGVTLDRCILSHAAIRNLRKNDKFINAITGQNPMYSVAGWGTQAALDFISDQTNVTFIEYDSVYRTRPLGSNTMTANRFTRADHAIFLPSAGDVADISSEVGFASTLTSPHPEGNWTPGYYEWERETVDPWGRDMGTGVKAFPVFPHLDLTYVMKVL